MEREGEEDTPPEPKSAKSKSRTGTLASRTRCGSSYSATKRPRRSVNATGRLASERGRIRTTGARARGRGAQAPALRNLELIRGERGLAEAEGGKKEERMKKELGIKARLKKMGLCPIGYEWIRRAGGSHCMAWQTECRVYNLS